MTEAHKQNKVLVYDLRRDRSHRDRVLSQAHVQWQAYKRGEWPVHISEGRISKLFFSAYHGEHMFELDEGARCSTWIRNFIAEQAGAIHVEYPPVCVKISAPLTYQ